MKKTILMLLCLVASMSMWAVDWSTVEYLGDGAGGGAYSNKYKVEAVDGVTVVNIQKPGFATEPGLYITFPDAAFGEIRSNGVKLGYDVQGAGICLYISNFVDQETEVNVMNATNDEVRYSFFVYNVDGRFYTEYDHANADAVNAHETCSPKFTWETDNSGNVVITISAGEGSDGETYFRGAKGMNGTFTLEGGNIGDYFTLPSAYTDKYTFTLALTDPANKPALGTKISYTGQIECRSDIHTNDWSDYTFNGFSYGAKVRVVADETAPTSFTATVSEEKAKSVVVTLNATDDNSPRVYYTITDGAAGEWHTAGNSGEEINYTITGLNLNTAYTFSIVVADNAGNETSPIVLNATTTAGVTPVHTYGVIENTATHCWTGTWDGNGDATFNDFPYMLCYNLVRNNDNTISATTFVKVEPASDGKELFNTPGMVFQFVDYKGGTNYHDFIKNGNIYEASTSVDFTDGESAHFMFRMAYNAGGSTPEIWPTVAAEANTYVLNGQLVGEWYTICLPFNATIEGAKLYSITNVDGENLTISEVGNAAEAGKAYLYQPTATTVTATYTAVATHTADTYLTGNLSATSVELAAADNAYILGDDNMFHHIKGSATATIGQYKAYLKLSTPSAAKALRISFDTPTGINNIATEVNAPVYNLNGQRVAANQKGIVIVNGRKVLNK